MSNSVTSWNVACQAPLSSTISQSLLKFMSIELVMLTLSVTPFSFCLQSFPASQSFPMSWFLTWGGKSIGASASAAVLPMYIQGWFYFGLTCLISLLSKEHSDLLKHHNSKASILQCLSFFMVQLSHPYMTTGKTTALTVQISVGRVMSLLFNTLSRCVITFFQQASIF